MEELQEILMSIMDTYNQQISNDQKYEQVSKLWTKYYQLSNKLNIQLDTAYHLYLMCENECYKIDQPPIMKKNDRNEVVLSLNHLDQVLQNRKVGEEDGISRGEVLTLIDFVVNHTRNIFGLLGIDVQTNSLNGFCELGQALSIMPFEHLGLKVTKNKAKDAFGYPFNHSFGTVWFPVLENGKLFEEGYLIDTTYRQFFSSVRCNEGRYYALEENVGRIANPDPGYFVRDEVFAKKLLEDGYVLLNRKNAYLYGEGFYLASLDVTHKKMVDDRNFDYYHSILNSSSDYTISYGELADFDVNCFDFNTKNKIKQ